MVSVAISKGNDLPATNSSDALPVLTFREAYHPTNRNSAYMIPVTHTPVQSIFIFDPLFYGYECKKYSG
jgi:hypothetical protein